MALSTAVGLFHVFVGLMLVAAFLAMGGGFILWCMRLGFYPSYRDVAIEYMKLGVSILFVLVVLLAVAELVQAHTEAVLFAVGALVAFGLLIGVLYFLATSTSKGGEKEEHAE